MSIGNTEASHCAPVPLGGLVAQEGGCFVGINFSKIRNVCIFQNAVSGTLPDYPSTGNSLNSRAHPLFTAASLTAPATALTTPRLSTRGRMQSFLGRFT